MNLSGNVTIENTEISRNTALDGYWGGLALITTQDRYVLILNNCTFEHNLA